MAKLLGADAAKKITGQYIVVFKKSGEQAAVTEKRNALVKALEINSEFKLLHLYDIGTMIGFAAVIGPNLLETLLKDEDIDYIEFDQEVHALS